MTHRTFFITGTDTDCGKTWVTCALIHALRSQGVNAVASKPVAAGGISTPDGLRNEDALAFHALSPEYTYTQINPLLLPHAIAPHLAAAQSGVMLSAAEIAQTTLAPFSTFDGVLLVEGAGGWRVPLNEHETMADVALACSATVILVIGLRLGCLNHALLTYEAIRRDGVPIVGWVGNLLDNRMSCVDENLAALRQRIAEPCLGVLPFGTDPAALAAHLQTNLLL